MTCRQKEVTLLRNLNKVDLVFPRNETFTPTDAFPVSSYDPYFVYTYFTKFMTEGHWQPTLHLDWQSCNYDSFSNNLHCDMIKNSSGWSVHFTIENSAPKVDLVATANLPLPYWVDWHGGDTCAVVVSSTPYPSLCKGLNPPPNCPEDNESAVQQLVVVSLSCLLAAFGAFRFIGFILL
ncbi:hypothetical protein BDW59DRAFT_169944 [Aspergillus cavernicola]|uniref:DUF7136 domain-containing protein n=1 Tax=Aspergillus cavernicola TaxID=176166 RepID=A0ABR4ITX5_9EURO